MTIDWEVHCLTCSEEFEATTEDHSNPDCEGVECPRCRGEVLRYTPAPEQIRRDIEVLSRAAMTPWPRDAA